MGINTSEQVVISRIPFPGNFFYLFRPISSHPIPIEPTATGRGTTPWDLLPASSIFYRKNWEDISPVKFCWLVQTFHSKGVSPVHSLRLNF